MSALKRRAPLVVAVAVLAVVAMPAMAERGAGEDALDKAGTRLRIIDDSVVRDGAPSRVYAVVFQREPATVGPKSD